MKRLYLILFLYISFTCQKSSGQSKISQNKSDQFLKWLLEKRSEEIISERASELSLDLLKDIPEVNYSKNDSIKIQKQIDDNNLSIFNYKIFSGKKFVNDSTLKEITSKSAYIFLRISNPIFFENGKKIWILVEEHCGDNCGSGKIQVFRKIGSQYQLIAEKLIWIS